MTASLLPLLIEPKDFDTFLKQGSNTHDICIVDLSAESSYLEGHICGAVHVSSQELMSGQSPAPGRLPSIDKLNALFSRLGLSENTHFVVYDDEGNGWSGRFIWTLDVINHKKYSVVNGGILAWRADNLDTQTKVNQRDYTEVNLNINQEPIAEIPYILEGIDNKTLTIWDARSPEEFRGEKILAAKGGHIPSAINCEWTSMMDPKKNYRIREDAEQRLADLGLSKNKPIATHCQSHHRSSFTYLLGKILGFSIKGYHGSWSEWGNHPDTPVER